MNQQPSDTTDGEIINSLAELSELQYQRQRNDKAKELGCKVGILDKLVTEARKPHEDLSIIEELLPHPGPVNGAVLYREVRHIVEKYLVFPPGTLHAICLWCIGTYTFDDFHIFPKLIFHSPEKRCGKSTALDVVEAISHRALLSSNITPAALFRVIEKYHPTLVIDEADTFIAGRNDELIGIINSGHARNRAYVIRTVGDNHEPKRFSTWSPQAFASIKRLPDTIMDRSIVISLRRKTAEERTSRVPADLKQRLKPLRQKLMRWHEDNQSFLKSNLVEPPSVNNDRAVDNWLPLFTIAGAIGAECSYNCKEAFSYLNSFEDEQSAQMQLLEDIKRIFEHRGSDRLASEALVRDLIELEERPWCEWKRGQPMTVNSLAKLLKDFGIKSKQYRSGDARYRGFDRCQFDDAFMRYLSTTPPSLLDTPLSARDTVTTVSDGAVSGFQPVTEKVNVTGKNDLKALQDGGCHGVTGQTGVSPEEGVITREL